MAKAIANGHAVPRIHGLGHEHAHRHNHGYGHGILPLRSRTLCPLRGKWSIMGVG